MTELLIAPNSSELEFQAYFDNLSEKDQFKLLTLNIQTKLTESTLTPTTYVDETAAITCVLNHKPEAERLWQKSFAKITVPNPPLEWFKPIENDPRQITNSIVVDETGAVYFWSESTADNFEGTSALELHVNNEYDPHNKVVIEMLSKLSDALNNFSS